MINLAQHLGIDDSKCKIPFGMVDEIRLNDFKNDGAIVAVTYSKNTNSEVKEKNRKMLQDTISSILKCNVDLDFSEFDAMLANN